MGNLLVPLCNLGTRTYSLFQWVYSCSFRLLYSSSAFFIIILIVTSVKTNSADLPAATEGERKLAWNPKWKSFDSADAFETGLGSIGALTLYLHKIPRRHEPAWRGGLLFDNWILRQLPDESEQEHRQDLKLADALNAISVSYPFLVDNLGSAWIYHGNARVAAEMFMLNWKVMSWANFLNLLVVRSTGRERPLGQNCAQSTSYSPFCQSTALYSSFWSGHTATAFAGAGLSCAHNQNLALFPPQWARGACISQVVLASVIGYMRVKMRTHYPTDVLMGAIFGWSLGYLYPKFFRYQEEDRTNPGIFSAGLSIVPYWHQDRIGLQIMAPFI